MIPPVSVMPWHISIYFYPKIFIAKLIGGFTAAIKPIFGGFCIFGGVGLVNSNEAYPRKVWICSLLGENWIDCVSGVYPTKSDHPRLGGTDSEGHYIRISKT
jgi:hypothetical protein